MNVSPLLKLSMEKLSARSNSKLYYQSEKNILVYNAPEPDATKIAHYTDNAVRWNSVSNNGYVACPATLHNLQVLAWLKQPIIEPMGRSYDWPRNKLLAPNPFASQIVTSNFLVANPHCLCLSDPGTGKTLSALWGADWLMRDHLVTTGQRLRALVVAPLSALERTWGNEIFTHLMGRRTFSILHGTEKRRIRQLEVDADFYIINHDGLGIGVVRKKRQFEITGLAEAIMLREDIGLVIFDEISAYRDGGTDRHRAARIACVNRKYVWGLTGTPTPNAPTDAHGIVRVVRPELEETFTAFKNRTMIRITEHKWHNRPGAHQAAFELMQPCIRFALEECVDLPDMIYVYKDVDLSDEQKKYWRLLRQNLLLEVEKTGGKITIANQAALRGKLMQLSAGRVYDQEHTDHPIDNRPRMKVLREAIEEAGEAKVIIFAPLTSVVNMLNEELKQWSRMVINGQTPFAQRNEIIKAFQTQKHPHLLIADPGTMSHSLNLTKASTVIWFVPTDKPETFEQANARIRRTGQTLMQRVVMLTSNKYESEVFARLKEKRGLQDVVLTLVEEQGL
jgi:SNF2 family DNA or RNA helicase